jgi:hypothetical protein
VQHHLLSIVSAAWVSFPPPSVELFASVMHPAYQAKETDVQYAKMLLKWAIRKQVLNGGSKAEIGYSAQQLLNYFEHRYKTHKKDVRQPSDFLNGSNGIAQMVSKSTRLRLELVESCKDAQDRPVFARDKLDSILNSKKNAYHRISQALRYIVWCMGLREFKWACVSSRRLIGRVVAHAPIIAMSEGAIPSGKRINYYFVLPDTPPPEPNRGQKRAFETKPLSQNRLQFIDEELKVLNPIPSSANLSDAETERSSLDSAVGDEVEVGTNQLSQDPALSPHVPGKRRRASSGSLSVLGPYSPSVYKRHQQLATHSSATPNMSARQAYSTSISQ